MSSIDLLHENKPPHSEPHLSKVETAPLPETQFPKVEPTPQSETPVSEDKADLHQKTRVPSSNFTEHLPPVDRNSLDLKEALANIQPPQRDSSSERRPENTNEIEEFEKLLQEIDSDDEDEDKSEKEDLGLEAPTSAPNHLLQTDVIHGLSESEVKDRRSTYGFNQLKEQKRSHVKEFFMFFVGPIQFVMEGSLILAAVNEDWIDLGVMVGLLLLNATVGFVQDLSAGNVVKVSRAAYESYGGACVLHSQELKKGLALKTIVIRDSKYRQMLASELVPGDIIRLDEGSIVPADGNVLTSKVCLQVDQSAITGESLSMDKRKGDRLYQSSTIKRGEAFMIVTAIGDSTFVGRSAALVAAASTRKGHFTHVMGSITAVLLTFVILALVIIWITSFYRSIGIRTILQHTLAITIIGVPVGLPAVVTTTMAVGASYLAKKEAIVQKLSAIESLAGVEILCTDKTGTLTRNKLSLDEPYTVEGIEPCELMLVACLAASRKKNGLDAIDKAFLQSLKKYPNTKDTLTSFKIISFTPFDPVSKKVTAVVESPRGEKIICVKGAPPAIIRMVREAHEISEKTQKEYNETVADFACRGFRSLGVARKRENAPWELLGIVPCLDPPRHDTGKTVREAQELGLQIKMLTGDAVGIAKETARRLGLGENIYNSERLGLTGGGNMPGSKIIDFVEAADGFAEVFPQHKYHVVDVLQKRGHLVAMTGDGVNDAPSLKRADTGIAVEGSSDAARSAADIVFLAPGLSAIIDALKMSRQIFHRMYSYVVYRIALTIHMLVFLGLRIGILGDSMPIQLVVFIAIFADIATLAIAYDRAPYSPKPVKWNLPVLWGTAVLLGLILAAGTWICFITMNFGPGIRQHRGPRDSVVFLEIVLTENWLIFATRAGSRPLWSPMPSWQLIGAVLLVDILATAFCVLGWFNGGLRVVVTSPLTIVRVWLFSFAVFCLIAIVYHLLAGSEKFDRLMHFKWPIKRSKEKRNLEDFIYALKRETVMHDRLD